MTWQPIVNRLGSLTETVLLFHSGTGKDSIMLLDILSKSMKVQPVFQYLVPNLEYENRYIEFAEKRYGVKFIKTPHYALYSFIKSGYLGIKKDPTQTKMTLGRLDAKIRLQTGLKWSVYGFKKIDGITRRLMLNSCDNGIMMKTQKAYPLMDLRNKDVLDYISDSGLIPPFNYGTKKPSSGCDISTPQFLAYIRKNHPSDLQRIFNQFPLAEINLFKYDQYKNQPEIESQAI